MTLTEKAAYIRGLAAGVKLDESKDETKIINAMLDLLDDMAVAVSEMENLYDEMSEQLDEVDEDLAELEDDFYDDDCDCDCCDDDDCDCCGDGEYYEVKCGKCGETVLVDEDTLLTGEIECPSCGEILEFDFSDFDCCDDDCDDDCCCGCKDHE